MRLGISEVVRMWDMVGMIVCFVGRKLNRCKACGGALWRGADVNLK